MNKSITKFCEICQIKVEEDIGFHLLNNDCKLKLLPETDQHLTENSVVCEQCITDTQELKHLQIKDEGIGIKLLQDVSSNTNFKEVFVNDNTICVKEEPGVEKIKEEFNVGLIKDEVCDMRVVENNFMVTVNKESTKLYYCYDCGYCTDTEQKSIQHVYKQHKKEDFMSKPISEKIYQCDKCYYKSDYKGNLKTHILYKHIGEKRYQCDMCDYKCGLKSNLKTHISSKHTGEKPYQCDKCDYKSAHKSNLKSHISSKHAGEKPHQCDKCDYKSAYSFNLKMHKLSHTGEYPFQCDKCDYKCGRKSCLKTHISKHVEEKPYQCDKCDYKCGHKSNLKTHILSKHTGEKPYQCDRCDFKTAHKVSLKTHTLSHTGEYPFQCDKCDYKCRLKSRLKYHTWSQHTGENCGLKNARKKSSLKMHKLSHTSKSSKSKSYNLKLIDKCE